MLRTSCGMDKMKSKRFEDLYDAFEPIYYICKFAGIAMFSPKTINKKRRYMVTLFDIIFSIFPCVLFNIIFIIGLNTCSRTYDILIRAITAIMQRYANVLMYLACYFGALIHAKKFTMAVALIYKYDGYFSKQSSIGKKLHKSAKKRVWITLTIALSTNGIMVFIDTYDTITRSTPCFCMLLYTCSYTVTVFMECQMFVTLLELQERLKLLNHKINHVLTGTQSGNAPKELFVCSNIYNDLIDAGIQLNRYFEMQILTKIFVSSLFVLSALFYFTTNIKIGPDIGYLFDYMAFIYDIALNFFEVFVIIYAFSKTADEVRNCF